MPKFITFLLITALLPAYVSAEESDRHIHVNKEHLTEENIAILDKLFNKTVPNGFYLINFQTGEWGYEGSEKVHGVLETVAQAYKEKQQAQSTKQNNRTEVYNSQNGNAISGKLNGRDCTFVSAGGFTMKSCD